MTRDLVGSGRRGLGGIREVLGTQVSPEFLKARIEVGTTICRTVGGPAATSAGLRRQLVRCGRRTRYAVDRSIDPTRSPTGRNSGSRIRERYLMLAKDLRSWYDAW